MFYDHFSARSLLAKLGNSFVYITGSDEPVDRFVCTTGSDEPVDSVVCTPGPAEPASDVTPCWTSDEEYDEYEGNVVLLRTGSDEPVDSVVRTTGSNESVNSVAVTFSADTVSVVTTGVAFQDKCDVPSDSGCDYDDYCYDGHYDENPDYFDYDDPGDFDNYPDVHGFTEPDDYELYHDIYGLDDCGLYCICRGEAGGTSYWASVEKGDDYEGNGVLPRMSRSTVLSVLPGRLNRSPVTCPAGPVMGNLTIMRGMLSYPEPGPMNRSTLLFVLPAPMSRSTVLFVVPGRMDRSMVTRPAIPVVRNLMTMRGSDEPVDGVVRTSRPDEPVSGVTSCLTGVEECIVYAGEVARTGYGESVNGVTRTSGLDDPDGSCDVDSRNYVRHHVGISVKTANLGKWFPPWTVKRAAWNMALKTNVSGISTAVSVAQYISPVLSPVLTDLAFVSAATGFRRSECCTR